ncbi:MAG: hypothetical protein M5F18_03700 [Asgard group archaeon]|nr:hypothetical protein [Asgard group archaeon]
MAGKVEYNNEESKTVKKLKIKIQMKNSFIKKKAIIRNQQLRNKKKAK